MAFRWWADGGPFSVAFRSSLTTPSDKMFWIRACMQCVWTGLIEIKLSCADPESFVRADPTLTMFVFKVDKGREDPSPTLSGPSSARQRNAIEWRFAGMPMNAQHWMLASQLRFFSGSGHVLLENPIFCNFSGGVRAWIRTCNFMIFWYLQRATKTQTSLRKCAFSRQPVTYII